ncbi:serine/threonine-protein kinase [Embleya sp. NPDC055664]
MIADRLGSGGMGEVFLGHSPAGDPVAVKVIRSDQLDPKTRARFEKEAQVARTVVNTNRVARFLDADPFADRPWLAMEFVSGHTLDAHIAESGTLPVLLVASLGALLAEGLGAVHGAGLFHRDLKPQNLILGAHGPVVIDFGLAAFADRRSSLSQSGTIIGTVRCMPPEQASGHPKVTAAADVYAFGTVLLYAATAHYPYEGVGWAAVVAQVVNPDQQPDLAGVPDALRPLIKRMLAHKAADRPTLDEVTTFCTRLIAECGSTPAAARQALVARTAGLVGAATIEVPAPGATKVYTEDAVIVPVVSVPSALDHPAVKVEARSAEEIPPQPPRVAARPHGRWRPDGAPKAVADRLREAYRPRAGL